jgi:hypothetical protein
MVGVCWLAVSYSGTVLRRHLGKITVGMTLQSQLYYFKLRYLVWSKYEIFKKFTMFFKYIISTSYEYKFSQRPDTKCKDKAVSWKFIYIFPDKGVLYVYELKYSDVDTM